MHQLRSQPLRSIYLTLHILGICFVRLPVWLIASILPSTRPYRTWSLVKCIVVRALQLTSEFGPIAEKAGPVRSWPDYRAIPASPAAKSVWLEPSTEVIVGDVETWAKNAGVKPERIPGYWIDKEGFDTPVAEKPSADERVVLYIHGGGFISDSAHPSHFLSTLPRAVLTQCPSAKRAFAVEYRLCELTPVYTHPFPSALIDAVAGYNYLIEVVGVAPSNIILVGDSAGGNLVLALARYIAENITALSSVMHNMPSSPPDYDMILLSPWGDLGTSHETPGSTTLDNTNDFLSDLRTGIFAGARRAYSDSLGFPATDTNAYLSPASLHVTASFESFPRTFIVYGSAERFMDMCKTLRDKMVKDMGEERVGHFEAEDAVHDHLLFPFEPSNTDALTAIRQWLAKRQS